jgi:hypothetical protein
MEKSWKLVLLFVVLTAAGCASVTKRPPLNANVNDVIQTATFRAGIEWMCSDVTGTLKGVKEPPKRQHWYDPELPTQYSVAVAGCGRSSTYTILCPQDAPRCYAVVPGEEEPVIIEELVPGSGVRNK